MPRDLIELKRWEQAASAIATTVVALATIMQENTIPMQQAAQRLIVPSWFKTLLAVPDPVWWLLTALLAAALFWGGVQLAKRWGMPLLFLAPALLLVLQFLVPIIMYGPIRAGVPAAGNSLY